MKHKLTALLFFLILSGQSCITIPNQHQGFPPGVWRGVIYIQEHQELIVTEGRKEVVTRDVEYEAKSRIIPFNFEIRYNSASKPVMVVQNDLERIVFNEIVIGRDRKTGDDTFQINLTPYDACLKGVFEEDKMRGHFIVRDKKDYAMPFEARFGQAHRFAKIPKVSRITLAPRYQVVFADTSEARYDAIGEFRQNGQIVGGTFRTESGDFRYLEGVLEEDQLSLSCFDGAHAYLFEAQVRGDSLIGSFYSGKHYKTSWRGVKTETGVLRPGDAILAVKPDSGPFVFGFTTPEGKSIRFDDPAIQSKVKLVQIMGSWCPNCMDESNFIRDYLREHPDPDLYVVGLSFERYADRAKAMSQIQKYRSRLDLPYEIAYGGMSHKDSAAAALPQLGGVKAYPTTLFIDRENRIVKVHTGFDGPATSRYQAYRNEFHQTMQQLLQHK